MSVVKRFLRIALKFDRHAELSWSQEGEDGILSRFFEGKKSRGFYIDVGAHSPSRFSNTKRFYDAGWHGINIDAMPGSMKPFRKARRRDINLEVGIGASRCTKEIFVFNEPAINSFSKDLSLLRDQNYDDFSLIGAEPVDVYPLSEILTKHLVGGAPIDFMSIDVEGYDFEVLKSNDWKLFRPHLVLVEMEGVLFEDVPISDVGMFMAKVGYSIFAKTVNTVFFIDINR